MRRLVAVLVALIGALLLAVGHPGHAVAAVPISTDMVPTHTYDNDTASVRLSTSIGERGPPTFAYDYSRRGLAVDTTSHGISARLQLVTVRFHTTYDHGARVAQLDNGRATTDTAAGGREADLRAPSGAMVAANGGRTAARACSFAGATTVLMADGTRKPIEDIKVGDKVIATDPETGEQVAKTVEHVLVHDDTVIDLVVDGEVITTTEDHPFWSVTDQRFERADELIPGEKVLAADGRVITVSGLKFGTARGALAYNLTVEGIHTYHVGQNSILVHNTCPIKPVNLPAWRKVSIDMDHIASGHMVGGSRVSPLKDLFPDSMSSSQVAATVRQAYRYSSRVATQGDRVLVRGSANDLTIEMWINRQTRTIETAYPVGGP